jgi:hypothetical protein
VFEIVEHIKVNLQEKKVVIIWFYEEFKPQKKSKIGKGSVPSYVRDV